MAACEGCGTQITGLMAIAGARYCPSCIRENVQRSKQMPTDVEASTVTATHAPTAADSVQLSTETVIPFEDCERLGMVTTTCIFGSHLGKDILAGFRDLIGGRAASAEQVFADATDACLAELRNKAHALGANAVYAIHLSHRELAAGGKSMVMVSASGTAAKVAPPWTIQ